MLGAAGLDRTPLRRESPAWWLVAVCDKVLPCSGGQENSAVVGAVFRTSLLIAAALS